METSVQSLLTLDTSVLIGSRGLGVNVADVDYDIVVPLYAMTPKARQQLVEGRNHDIDAYFNVIPPGGGYYFSGWASGINNVDLIVLNSMEDINIVFEVMAELNTRDKELMKSKVYRIAKFEEALRSHGWKPNSPGARSKTYTKTGRAL